MKNAIVIKDELTKKQIERQDLVDNAIHRLINELNPSGEEVEWDICAIREVGEVIEEGLVKAKHCTEMEFYPYLMWKPEETLVQKKKWTVYVSTVQEEHCDIEADTEQEAINKVVGFSEVCKFDTPTIQAVEQEGEQQLPESITSKGEIAI